MKKKLEAAVVSGDVPAIRTILIEMVSGASGKTAMIEDLTSVVQSTEGLFEPDDGKYYAPNAKKLNKERLGALREEIKQNFSLKKFHLLVEAQQILRGDPGYYERVSVEAEIEPAPLAEFAGAEATTAGVVTTDLVGPVEERSAEELAEMTYKGNKGARTVGFVMIILGAVASIVGICVPVRFLVGLGIGVLMLGAAVVYTSLPKE